MRVRISILVLAMLSWACPGKLSDPGRFADSAPPEPSAPLTPDPTGVPTTPNPPQDSGPLPGDDAGLDSSAQDGTIADADDAG